VIHYLDDRANHVWPAAVIRMAQRAARFGAWVLVLGFGVAAALPAQTAHLTGTLLVTVLRPDSTPLAGAFVRSERFGGVADDSGRATVELPARLVSVEVTHPGFEPRRFEITILPNVSQRYALVLEPRAPSAAAASIQSARVGRRPGDEPMPILVLGPDDLTRRAQAHPSDLSRLFSGILGIRAQALSGPLDATRFRANGIRGHYTGLLVDGLPLLGRYPGGYGIMQLSPLEFDQVEWVKGTAAALYGSAASGGLVNLISRRPDRDRLRIGVNQSSEKGGDVVLWAGRRRSPTVAATVFADFHQQRLVDADDDSWGEFPRVIRFSVRPRLYLDRPNGDGLVATVGLMSEDRTGGFLFAGNGSDRYREERRTRRFDTGVSARRIVGSSGLLQIKLATVLQGINHRFEDLRERDDRSTVSAEGSYTVTRGRATMVAGLGYQREELSQEDYPAFDYTHSVPSAFGSLTLAASERVIASIAGRCDDHSVHGTQCFPRVDLLLRANPQIDARVFGGLAYTAPTPLADEAETLGFHATIPIAAKAERLALGGVDLRWRGDAFQLNTAVTFTRVGLPVRLVPFAGDTLNRLRLLNVSEPTRVLSVDLRADYLAGPVTVGAFYGFRKGSEGVPGGTGRRDIDVTPRHQLGFDLRWQPRIGGTAAYLDFLLVGPQTVTDNGFRTRTMSYVLANGLVSQRSGRASLYLSAENLFDLKLGSYDPVFLESPVAGDRRTNTPWIPLRGRVVSLGALVDW
jgi:iron complex outermembrane receptor protein